MFLVNKQLTFLGFRLIFEWLIISEKENKINVGCTEIWGKGELVFFHFGVLHLGTYEKFFVVFWYP